MKIYKLTGEEFIDVYSDDNSYIVEENRGIAPITLKGDGFITTQKVPTLG